MAHPDKFKRRIDMKQLLVKPEKCMGCKSCEISCSIQHSNDKTLFSAIKESPLPQKRLFVETAENIKMPVICKHCEDAPCLNACISGCLYRDENGFVRRHKERCIGCWTCVMLCPFGVITKDKDKHIALKCDRCNELEIPACVNACPTHAIIIADIDEITKEKRLAAIIAETKNSNA